MSRTKTSDYIKYRTVCLVTESNIPLKEKNIPSKKDIKTPCRFCGKDMSSLKVCPYCGQYQIVKTTFKVKNIPPTSEKLCPSCGKKLITDGVFCQFCGLNTKQQQKKETSPQKKETFKASATPPQVKKSAPSQPSVAVNGAPAPKESLSLILALSFMYMLIPIALAIFLGNLINISIGIISGLLLGALIDLAIYKKTKKISEKKKAFRYSVYKSVPGILDDSPLYYNDMNRWLFLTNDALLIYDTNTGKETNAFSLREIDSVTKTGKDRMTIIYRGKKINLGGGGNPKFWVSKIQTAMNKCKNS